MPVPFLSAVARAYLDRYDEMSDVCFVFPNKRSGTFFLKNLSENLGRRTILAPAVMDIAEFTSRISGLEAAPRIDMLFRLYKVYCSLAGKSDSLRTQDDLLDFDRFAPWGEIVLGDFSEVEKYDVDADAIFKNVRDYRNIASNFLTEEQCEVIERYFGYKPLRGDVEGFWKSFGDREELTQLKEKFISLWELLPELFQGFVDSLSKDGLALPGTIFRRALRRIEEEGRESLEWQHLVFVGFNMLSVSEARIFASLRDLRDEDGEPFAEFFWDATGPVLGTKGDTKGLAAKAMRRNMKIFPMPGWARPFISASETDVITPKITVAGAPSNVAQTKIAALTIREWLHNVDMAEIRNAKTAVVIPDENLLMPLLHSLPQELEFVNLTMGYSMRYTSVASFVYHLRRLQSRRRKTGAEIGYYYEDLRIFLSHPLVHVVIGTDTANTMNGEMMRRHLRVVPLSWIAGHSEILGEMLGGVSRTDSADIVVEYIDRVLLTVDKALTKEREGLPTVNSKIERSQIALYRQALTRLQYSMRRHGIDMNYQSVFHLADRLLAGEKVTFEGEPLEGLQIMGLLETRALDFEHLIILSMNDKVMPRRSRKRTFIPDSLRRGYGMPTPAQGEELYSYYFYRLISRASDVTLIYDARAGEGMRSGGKSRYLMQLDMLYDRNRIVHKNYSFMLDSSQVQPRAVVKTPDVMRRLDAFQSHGPDRRNLSASALMNYCACPVKFYFKNVVNINDDSEPGSYIDPITQGQIIHKTMLNLYFPPQLRQKYLKGKERIIFTADDFKRILEDRATIEATLRRAVNEEHFHISGSDRDRELTGAVAMVADRLVRQVEDVIRHDIEISPIEMVGGEFSENIRWKAGESPEVNMRYAFDRVDRVGGRLRVIDYKTGSSHVEAEDFEEVFNGAYNAKYLLQLLLYAHLLEGRVSREEGILGEDIAMEIYDVNVIGREGAVRPKIDKMEIVGHKMVSEDFKGRMETLLSDLFDPEKPFMPTEDEENCRYCAFRALCGR